VKCYHCTRTSSGVNRSSSFFIFSTRNDVDELVLYHLLFIGKSSSVLIKIFSSHLPIFSTGAPPPRTGLHFRMNLIPNTLISLLRTSFFPEPNYDFFMVEPSPLPLQLPLFITCVLFQILPLLLAIMFCLSHLWIFCLVFFPPSR